MVYEAHNQHMFYQKRSKIRFTHLLHIRGSVISQKFLIEYYEYSFDSLLIIMDQL